ncbi:MAG: hypothetical protein KIS62_10860 [Ramlibacter sp.]|nr:hypothetical protein [Ramlibacter sp.]
MTVSSLVWGVLFGAIGMGYFVYGKRQGAMVPLLCGVALMVFPYFISNNLTMVLVGGALSAMPYFLGR